VAKDDFAAGFFFERTRPIRPLAARPHARAPTTEPLVCALLQSLVRRLQASEAEGAWCGETQHAADDSR
jgi:hypothetical protein